MVAQPQTRADEIKAIHREYKTFYQIAVRVFLVGIGVLIGIIWFSSDLDRSAYIVNLFTTFLGTLATVLVIDFLNRRRDDQRELRQLQEQLVRDAGSTSNEIAKNAVHQLQKRGWLEGDTGLLQGAHLGSANLQGVDLIGANLQEANLFLTNLQEANLYLANLQRAILFITNLQGANLSSTNLQGAHLGSANLQGVDLTFAKLQGANLIGTNLQGAKVNRAQMDETTILPDRSRWTPDTDLTKFGCIVE